MGEEENRATARWINNTAKPLTWDADGEPYTPTGLVNHIFTSVAGRTADGIQDTTWWDVDTDLVPGTVDPDAWAALAGTSLAVLAKQLSGTREDWTSLHTLLEAISAHEGSPASILEAEGIRFDASAAAQEARLPLNELRQLREA
ncbi:hypothetical protein [Streptomyces sp. RKAG293]|uniref:hypothetical protein n=1 Tax=Streptomyces sp. RKAG293 TaxID=2893403 RepID=UPI0020336C84|nr:hypothetical protein [Streptomyces sp. RKAG293]MCM2418119.1 hypothetical protein [Streptomyces sp. RKAG293]